MVDRSRDLNGEDLAAALIKRGVNPALTEGFVTRLGTEIVRDTVDWFDAEQRRRPLSAGALVIELRAGGRRPRRARSLMDEQRDYADQIVAWLREHFPDLVDDGPSRFPHPAAISEVIRLHWRHGKGNLTVREHGPAIRAAVKAFEHEWGLDTKQEDSNP